MFWGDEMMSTSCWELVVGVPWGHRTGNRQHHLSLILCWIEPTTRVDVCSTQPKFNSSPLKDDGWKKVLSFWECLFSGATLNFWGVSLLSFYRFFHETTKKDGVSNTSPLVDRLFGGWIQVRRWPRLFLNIPEWQQNGNMKHVWGFHGEPTPIKARFLEGKKTPQKEMRKMFQPHWIFRAFSCI